MKTKNVLKWLAMIVAMGLFGSCSDDEKMEESPTEIKITQSQLNGADNFIMDATGGSFAHGGPDQSAGDMTLRKVYASLNSLSGNVKPGTIVAKKTFAKDASGNASDLYVSFVMVKREPGFDTANKDWEYMSIPFDASNDYGTNMFGKLPAEGADNRGKLAGCIGCHGSAGGGDFLYSND